MPIEVIQRKTPKEVRAAVDGFANRYVDDWNDWVGAAQEIRPELFGRILRSWQATRPLAMRRLKSEAKHRAPYLEDILEMAAEPISVLGDLTVLTIARRTSRQNTAFNALWDIFSRLTTSGSASCVGITKSVLLVTDGRIGPAFDSKVRAQLGIGRPKTCHDWLAALEGVAADIAMFESAHGPLTSVVSSRFASLAYGRLYDMTLGPR